MQGHCTICRHVCRLHSPCLRGQPSAGSAWHRPASWRVHGCLLGWMGRAVLGVTGLCSQLSCAMPAPFILPNPLQKQKKNQKQSKKQKQCRGGLIQVSRVSSFPIRETEWRLITLWSSRGELCCSGKPREGWLQGHGAADSRGGGVPRLGRRRKAVMQEMLLLTLGLGVQCCEPCAWFEKV